MARSRAILAGLAAIATALVASAQLAAQTPASALVELRSTVMKQMGGTFRVFGPIMQGQNKNLADAVPAAAKVNTLAGLIIAAFPPGSGQDAVPATRAKPEVWSERAEFEANAKRLIEESGKLVMAAQSNDVEAFKTQFKAFVGACGSCHSGKSAEGGKFRFAEN